MKLTKTDYLIYLDAPRHLWAYKNDKIENKEIDLFTQNLFEQGYDVQKKAHEYIKESLIPNEYGNTKDFKFEVTVQDDLFEARTDVLIKNPATNKYTLVEIKSTNKVKIIHLRDVTFQYLVFAKHYDIESVRILHMNKDYIRDGELNIDKLFFCEPVTNKVNELIDTVQQERFEALEVMNATDYNQTTHCTKPKNCPCITLCHPNLPDYSIYNIARISGKKLEYLEQLPSRDIYDIPNKLPKGYEFSQNQQKQVDVAHNNTPIIDKAEIQSRLDELEYPLYFIDYESFNPAIPMYDKYKPYDQMPFQYSLHIRQSPESEYIHKEFLEINPVDPAINLLEAMQKDIGDKGSIIIWSKFERTQNKAMLRRYPLFNDLLINVNSRLFDLMEIFQQMLYVDAGFKGSCSIKKVLPVLVPELSYKGMPIGDGAMAMTKWVQMVYGGGISASVFTDSDENEEIEVDIEKDKVDKQKTAQDLLKYCELDTWAMVRILEVVSKKIGYSPL